MKELTWFLCFSKKSAICANWKLMFSSIAISCSLMSNILFSRIDVYVDWMISNNKKEQINVIINE